MHRAQDYNIINITTKLKPAFINFIIVLQFVILFWTKENTLKPFSPKVPIQPCRLKSDSTTTTADNIIEALFQGPG